MSKLTIVALIGLFVAVNICLVSGGPYDRKREDGFVYFEGIPYTHAGWGEHLGRSLDYAEQLGRHFYNNFVYTRYFHKRVVSHLKIPGLTRLQKDRLEVGAAALDEDLEGVKRLLPVVAKYQGGLNFHLYGDMCSLLDMATYRGDTNLNVIKYIVENGANIAIENRYGENALYVATVMGHLDVVRYLLERGADSNSKNKEGISVAMAAAYLGKPDVLRTLLKKGASVDPIINDPEVVELLIEKPRADCKTGQKVFEILSEFGNGWRLTSTQLAIYKEMNECSSRK